MRGCYMGQEIGTSEFTEKDYAVFVEKLHAETQLLASWFADNRLDNRSFRAGYELEGWILDREGKPVPDGERFLDETAHPDVVAELSRFNVELNGTPHSFGPDIFSRMECDLKRTWEHCQIAAQACGDQLLLIGTLPTIKANDLSVKNMSPLNRYRALNRQIMRARGGKPILLDIQGKDHLSLQHKDVMLEAGATSFQIHFQVPAVLMVRVYNASIALSGPLVALTANSPFLFGKQLWAETRIPLFEQAVDSATVHQAVLRRVTFGSGYLHDNPMDMFRENLGYPLLLPVQLPDEAEALSHLKLHNGTIWRWNRLLVESGDRPCLRIEHRTMAAGPSLLDMLANAAFYFGTVQAMSKAPQAIESGLPFDSAEQNFYAAARDGLDAKLHWEGKRALRAKDLLLNELLPLAKSGLVELNIDAADSNRLLGVIEARLRSEQTGAAWQLKHASHYRNDFQRLVEDYLENQQSGKPVHEWRIGTGQ
jgi:gamma-glutamylcysteine synthetase